MKELIRVMKSMSDPNRVRVLKLLQQKELCVCELQELLGLAQSTVSKHLKLLDDAGLIAGRRDGAWVIYRINETPKTDYAKTILAHIGGWIEDDCEFHQMRKRLPFINRINLSAS